MWLRRKNSEFGYILIYLFSSLFLLLVLSQFFIAILVAAWEAAGIINEEDARAAKLPPGYKWRPDGRSWYMQTAFLCFLSSTGYSLRARASAGAIKHALSHALSSLEFKINQQREEAENPYNPRSLTTRESDELFLFDNARRPAI